MRAKSWNDIANEFQTTHEFVRSFGPEKKFGLFRSKSKLTPKKFAASDVTIQPNFRYELLARDTDDPEVEKDWGLRNTSQVVGTSEAGVRGADISAFEAWNLFKGTKNTVVAILDTGIDFSHEDLKTNRWVDTSTGGDGWNFVANSNDTHDDNQHGTFCAGIIGADAKNGKGSRGVNWLVSMMAVKVLDKDGRGSTERAVSGIEYAVNHGAKIINASWGGTNYDQALYDSIKWAGERGVLFVAASGNSAEDNDDGANATFPAGYRLNNLISVASYDNRDKISKSSNFGKETTHIGAPGVQIFSTVPNGYNINNGTSFAAPYVSGVAALLWGFAPGLSVEEVKDRVLMSSTPIHYYEKERTQTAGRVNAFNALSDIRPPRPTVPTTWKRFPYAFNTAHPYNNYDTVTVKIVHPGATHVRVHFKRFETEKNYDKAVVLDANKSWVKTYSGEHNDEMSADTLGDTLQLDFEADYVKSYYGIEVDYYEVSTDP